MSLIKCLQLRNTTLNTRTFSVCLWSPQFWIWPQFCISTYKHLFLGSVRLISRGNLCIIAFRSPRVCFLHVWQAREEKIKSHIVYCESECVGTHETGSWCVRKCITSARLECPEIALEEKKQQATCETEIEILQRRTLSHHWGPGETAAQAWGAGDQGWVFFKGKSVWR